MATVNPSNTKEAVNLTTAGGPVVDGPVVDGPVVDGPVVDVTVVGAWDADTYQVVNTSGATIFLNNGPIEAGSTGTATRAEAQNLLDKQIALV